MHCRYIYQSYNKYFRPIGYQTYIKYGSNIYQTYTKYLPNVNQIVTKHITTIYQTFI